MSIILPKLESFIYLSVSGSVSGFRIPDSVFRLFHMPILCICSVWNVALNFCRYSFSHINRFGRCNNVSLIIDATGFWLIVLVLSHVITRLWSELLYYSKSLLKSVFLQISKSRVLWLVTISLGAVWWEFRLIIRYNCVTSLAYTIRATATTTISGTGKLFRTHTIWNCLHHFFKRKR